MGKNYTITEVTAISCEFRTIEGERKRVLVRGGMAYTFEQFKSMDLPVINLVPGGEPWKDAKVFRLELSKKMRKRWTLQPEYRWLAAFSRSAVESWAEKHYAKIADRQIGLAKCALGVAMNEISKKTTTTPGVSRRAATTAPLWVDVKELKVGEDGYVLDIRDNLDYAKEALRNPNAVEIGLKKAANKVAGYLQHNFKNLAGWQKLEPPFPEVKRRRKSA